jgi:hypothetical protein
MWETIQKMLLESSIVQGILTLGVSFFVCLMLYQGKAVTQELWLLLGTAWGFYFGSKTQQATRYNIEQYSKACDGRTEDR